MKKSYSILIFTLFFISQLGLNAQSAKRFFNEGVDALEKSNYNDAADYFSKALMLNTTYHEAYTERARCYEKLGKNDLAVNDYNAAIAIKSDEKDNYILLGILYLKMKKYQDAVILSKKGIDIIKKEPVLHRIQAEAKYYLDDNKSALNSIESAISLEKNDFKSYYVKSLILLKNGDKTNAVESSRKSIDLLQREAEYKEAVNKSDYLKYFTTHLNNLYMLGSIDECLNLCNQYLAYFPKNDEWIYYYRSMANDRKFRMNLAMDDISNAIVKNDKVSEFFIFRAELYQKIGQYEPAIGDFSKAIFLEPTNLMAVKGKGKVYEAMQKFEDAQKMYMEALKINPSDNDAQTLVKNLEKKLFEQNREKSAPEILISGMGNESSGDVFIPRNTVTFELTGKIKDQSRIRSLLIMDEEVKIDTTVINPVFSCKIKTIMRDEFSMRAEDVYGNSTEKIFKIKRSENVPPQISINSPKIGNGNTINLNNLEGFSLTIEGLVSDESPITEILINKVKPMYEVNALKTNFKATLDVVGLDSIIISATDVFNNKSLLRLRLINDTSADSLVNPMGKTWVVFIDNSKYKNLPVLEATSNDVAEMNAALKNYSIDKIIIKKDMTKTEMDKFFSIELRDQIIQNQVNSLMIWFAGHGKFLNETGYWLPVDANKKDEFTYFGLNQLKSFLSNYKTIKHTLVISDACETGPAFYLAMREINTNRNCSDWEATKLKSAQVISSATLDLNDDKSIFTKSFAGALKITNDKCLPIEKIYDRVSTAAKQNQKPKPKLGNIQGLQDENGTFFFIKK